MQIEVSLYSFTDEYIKGKFTLEDCIRTIAEYGAEGSERVGKKRHLEMQRKILGL